MTKRLRENMHRSAPKHKHCGRRTDAVYAGANRRYLALLAAACIIASLFVGPGMILVWIVTAVVLTWDGSDRDHRKSNCKQRRR